MRPVLIALVCGLVFALGLGLSGMVNPARVLGFLDLTGDWEPNLMFVLGDHRAGTAHAQGDRRARGQGQPSAE